MKKCPNCKKELEQLDKNGFNCEECKEIFTLVDGKLKPLEDKKEFFVKLNEKLNGYGKRLKDVAEKYGIETDDDEPFFFG